LNPEDLHRKVNFNVQGKEFIALVKISRDSKTWTMLYQNESNPDDWFIRNEICSQELWKYGRQVLPQTYNHLFQKLISKA
jgi:hypothetical protein